MYELRFGFAIKISIERSSSIAKTHWARVLYVKKLDKSIALSSVKD